MTSELTIVLLVSILTTLLLICLTIYLFSVFYKSKSRLQKEKAQLESTVSRSQLEIREDFMRNAGKELHDNIGQVLSTAKLQLSMSEHKAEHADSIALIAQSLNDIRNLSKVVDPDAINSMGLLDSFRIEMERLDRLPHITTNFEVIGKPFELSSQKEIILFRIIQESLNNCLKHSQTDKIDLSLHFDKSKININLKDYGVGFDKTLIEKSGSGLHNMEMRADMIGASYKMESEKGRGTTIEIKYQEHPNYEQNSNRNS